MDSVAEILVFHTLMRNFTYQCQVEHSLTGLMFFEENIINHPKPKFHFLSAHQVTFVV